MDNLGQLIITGISGLSLTDEESQFISEAKIGGVILFSNNYKDPGQLAELVNSIQALRDEFPLFIATDHEGGRVQRFKTGFTHFPAMLDIARLNSPKLIYEVHEIMAKELISCGVNVNFSPVCDVLTNDNNKVIGDRAFGLSVDDVEKNVSAAVRGLQTSNMIACAKHFPGHGSTSKDSHFDLPIIKTSYEDLKNKEYKPFNKAVKSKVEMVMMAHLVVDAIDSTLPTSLSKKAYDELRGPEFKFSKIIITDDMEMKAIADHFTLEQSAVLALNAGADMLLYRYTNDAKTVYEHLKNEWKSKKISKDDVLEKIKRIELVKKQYLSEYSPVYIPTIPEKMKLAGGEKLLKEIKTLLVDKSKPTN